MKLKKELIFLILLICVIFIIFLFSSGLFNNFDEFSDAGVDSEYNSKWINQDLTINRSANYTTLSNNMSSSQQYIAKKIIYEDCVIEWDNHGEPNNSDYCILSDSKNNKSNLINFIDDLGITGDCHVKLVISDGQITPYVNNEAKTPIKLNVDLAKGLLFRFQINPGGADIRYSNFTIHK